MAATIIISICIAAVVGLTIWYMIRKNKKARVAAVDAVAPPQCDVGDVP